MTTTEQADITVASLLAAVPGYQRWRQSPLPADLQRLVRDADDQTLLGLVALGLQRIVRDESER